MSTRPVVAALALALLSACSSSSDSDVSARAIATIRTQDGTQIGTAQFVESDAGVVSITVNVTGLSEGNHGMHVHEFGVCDGAAGFGSTGGHYNPFTKKHGLDNPEGPHGGDLPNLPSTPAAADRSPIRIREFASLPVPTASSTRTVVRSSFTHSPTIR